MANEIMATNETNAIVDTNDFMIPNGYICTVDLSTLDGKLKLASAINGAVTMRDKVNETLHITDIVTTQGVRSRTGEVCTNSYLISEDGTVYFSQSDGIARSLKVLVAIFTDNTTGKFTSPVELGIGLQVRETVLPNGNTLKTVVPVTL